jgi:hypothetical protein
MQVGLFLIVSFRLSCFNLLYVKVLLYTFLMSFCFALGRIAWMSWWLALVLENEGRHLYLQVICLGILSVAGESSYI